MKKEILISACLVLSGAAQADTTEEALLAGLEGGTVITAHQQ